MVFIFLIFCFSSLFCSQQKSMIPISYENLQNLGGEYILIKDYVITPRDVFKKELNKHLCSDIVNIIMGYTPPIQPNSICEIPEKYYSKLVSRKQIFKKLKNQNTIPISYENLQKLGGKDILKKNYVTTPCNVFKKELDKRLCSDVVNVIMGYISSIQPNSVCEIPKENFLTLVNDNECEICMYAQKNEHYCDKISILLITKNNDYITNTPCDYFDYKDKTQDFFPGEGYYKTITSIMGFHVQQELNRGLLRKCRTVQRYRIGRIMKLVNYFDNFDIFAKHFRKIINLDSRSNPIDKNYYYENFCWTNKYDCERWIKKINPHNIFTFMPWQLFKQILPKDRPGHCCLLRYCRGQMQRWLGEEQKYIFLADTAGKVIFEAAQDDTNLYHHIEKIVEKHKIPECDFSTIEHKWQRIRENDCYSHIQY